MSQSQDPSGDCVGPGSSQVSFKAIQRILLCISSNHLNIKSFIKAFLSSQKPELVKAQHVWGSSAGLPSTERILCKIRDVLLKTKVGRKFWEEWVLSQAVLLVKKQHPPCGKVPKGFYIDASEVTPSDFDHGIVYERDMTLEKLMPFLFNLIQSTFTHSEVERVREATVRKARLEQKQAGGKTPLETRSAIDENIDINSDDESEENIQPGSLPVASLGGPGGSKEDEEYIDRLNGYVYRKSKDHQENRKTRHRSVARTICSMISNVCNRRVNTLQVENGLTMLALNGYLNYIGLSVNRRTAINALEHLGQELKKKIVDVMGKDTSLAPFITLDNIDFQQHIHTSTVERESTMWHGSWGYIHQPTIPEGISIKAEDFTSEKLKAILDESQTKPIDLAKILPTPTEISDWELTLKSQISVALVKYVAKPIEGKQVPYQHLPAVRPLPAKKPDIMMLKMMSALDNSTSGVGELYNSVLNQTGLSREKYASRAQVWEGDLGTARIVASVVDERDPCSRKERVNMTPEKMKLVIDQTYNEYFGPEAIQNAKNTADQKHL
ncbi:uncharacterized protein MELLADRAFT_107092 [Melampsora larici-populina 98AG31]|uniref:DUF6589 domain-containing protein n=1 Tax=Melampsora larici-populina (strain 98AG31 / pathotype 3-4-7) TaxID=747676 RepID=F4RNM9_MELLP|nr:uncharacterized protein MELLADRAFT_107092 [Melampsora larici-populina 98AG31]EGG06063.1 hypothetical protein MELLADRAFT_107092 [Melampsora larici-populina 98AG31]